MRTIAFSGPTALTQREEAYVRSKVAGLRADAFVSGAAYGVDTVAIMAAWERHMADAEYWLTIPVGKWYNRDLEAFGKRNRWSLVYVDGGYMARNTRTVSLSDELVAFPPTLLEQRRSGTWATIRRARRKGIPVHLHPLSEA